jgi:Zn-dependent protease with chaperone function
MKTALVLVNVIIVLTGVANSQLTSDDLLKGIIGNSPSSSQNTQIIQVQITAAPTLPVTCPGPQLAPTHPQAKLAYAMRARLNSTLTNVPLVVYASLDINAYALPGPTYASGGTICLPQGMVVFFEEAPDELAAIIAHEMGHAIDETCRFNPKTISQQRLCEDRADEIGFRILQNANPPFNPAAMAGAFGRIESLYGDTSTGLLARIAAFKTDHPITPDRIQHVHRMIISWAASH